MANEIVTPIGLDYVQILGLAETGLIAVSSPTVEYSGLRISGAKALNLQIPEPEIVRQTGDNRVFTSFVLPPAENVSGELTTGKMNLTVDALLTGATIVTLGEFQMMTYATNLQGNEPLICMLAYSRGHNTDPSDDDFNDDLYRWYLAPKTQIIPRLAPAEERAVSDHMYTVDVKRVKQYPWGLDFATGTEGATESELIAGTSPARPRLCGWLANGTATEFTFGKEARATSNINVYVNSVVVTTGVTKAVGSITFDTAPTDTYPIVVFYDTEVE